MPGTALDAEERAVTMDTQPLSPGSCSHGGNEQDTRVEYTHWAILAVYKNECRRGKARVCSHLKN